MTEHLGCQKPMYCQLGRHFAKLHHLTRLGAAGCHSRYLDVTPVRKLTVVSPFHSTMHSYCFLLFIVSEIIQDPKEFLESRKTISHKLICLSDRSCPVFDYMRQIIISQNFTIHQLCFKLSLASLLGDIYGSIISRNMGKNHLTSFFYINALIDVMHLVTDCLL